MTSLRGRNVDEQEPGVYQVESGRRQPGAAGDPLEDLDVAQALLEDQLAGQIDMHGVDVHAGHPPGRPDPLGEQLDGPSGTTAQIQGGRSPFAVRCGRAWSA